MKQTKYLLSEKEMPRFYYNVIPEMVSDRVVGYRGSGTNFGSFWNLWSWDLSDGAGL